MIAKLTGVIDSTGEDWAVVDVGGVGYHVFCSARTLGKLEAVGAPVRLAVETHVREDHIHLYGFLDAAERDWFRLLMTVQGVGAKTALAILSSLAPPDLAAAIADGDKATVSRAQGIGQKLALRIVTELKDKAAHLRPPDTRGDTRPTSSTNDAVSALVNLGYRRNDAMNAVAGALSRIGADAPLDQLIKAGLKELNT
jgi:Holliday junction DNA helicase RuvA